LPESAELDGVLGSDLLHGLDVWIDPLAGRLRVDAPGALGGRYAGTTVRLETIAGRPALAIELLDLDRRPVTVRLVVDSGADSVLLFGRLAERLAAARGAGLARATGLATAHGAGAVSGVPIGRARCGDAKLRLGAALLLPEVRGRIEDGLVPLDRLGPVLFQLAGERAVLGARPGAAPAAPTADRLAATDRRNR
jgi:hypothetical protein